MRSLILCCVLCLGLMPAQAQVSLRDAQLLNELGSRGQLLSASALLYFNPALRTPDPRSLTAAYYHLNTLASHVQQLGQPSALAQPLQAIQRSFAALDGLSRKEQQRYPQLLEALLLQQRQLQHAAGEAYADSGLASPASASLLHQQSQDLASLLLDQQVRQYPWPSGAPVPLLGARVQVLDQLVTQRFSQLQLSEGQQKLLGTVQRNYQFVRSMLIDTKPGAQGGAEFYLTRAVLDLDELALNQFEDAP